jgi:hypothetical protein
VLRFIPSKLRIPVHFIGALATSAVCFAASWGFFDYISIEGFGVDRDAKAREKVSHVAEDLGDDFFIWRKQVGLDISALPDVAGGTAWDDPSRMNGKEWNELIRDGGFYERFEKEEVDMILAPDFALEESRVPMVQMPGKTVRGLLIHAMNLMFPIGLVFIGLRVMLRALLVLAGYSTVEPDPDDFEGVQDGIPAPTAAALRSIGEREPPAESSTDADEAPEDDESDSKKGRG